MNLRSMAFPMDFHKCLPAFLKFLPERTGEVGKTKTSSHPRRVAAGGYLSYLLTTLAIEDMTMGARDATIQENKAGQALPALVISGREHGLPSDEGPLPKVDGKVEPRIKGSPLPGQLLAVKRISHLKAKQIAGAKTCHDETVRFPVCDKGPIEGKYHGRGTKKLPSILPGISGPTHPENASFGRDLTHFPACHRFKSLSQKSNDGGRSWSLKGQRDLSRRLILKVDGRGKPLPHEGKIPFARSGIDNDMDRLRVEGAGDQVIDGPAVIVRKDPVKAFPKGNGFEIGGHESIHRPSRPGTPDNEMPHMRDIKKARGLPNPPNLLKNGGKCQGKLISMKICHASTLAKVLGGKGQRQGSRPSGLSE